MNTPLVVDPSTFSRDTVGFFRYGVVGERVLLTNDVGEHLFVSPEDFRRFIAGQVQREEPLYDQLRRRYFLKNDLDAAALADKLRRKKAFLTHGPHLHAVVTTLRCNHACKYCHASRTGNSSAS